MGAIQVNLMEQFPVIELFEAFTIFNPSKHPHNNYSQILMKLATQFTMLNKEELIREWAVAKTIKEGESKDFTCKGTKELFAPDKYRTIFPNIATLAATGLVISVSTADCEHAFSTLKHVCEIIQHRKP
ncbi:hypothetical protein HOLleu_08234 [Holothuria leucospilota]|uniref:HAT C-terminal dimerisation domain-containing protein n=1 Tax=Holothuria leucospilota TaxID=206669 RepID=A0A9Q1CHY2_HOLLE|nr:hypothetical protein HOLleu_08234 [Holothuria leucospilota]